MSAKPQVTITLGRSGQVVKRSGPPSEGFHPDYGTSSGVKRPMRERLRDSSDEYGGMPQNKRLRRENHHWNSDSNMNNDNLYQSNNQIGRNDLRFKLMRKKAPTRQMNLGSKTHDVDLRERLSRTGQTPYRFNPRKHHSEAESFGPSGRIPPTRSADDLLHMDSVRRSYSPGPLDRFRHRSPDRLVGSSRGLSPRRNYDDIRQRSSMRSLDPPRSTSAMEKRSIDVPRPAAFSTKAPYPAERPPAVMRPPPSNGTMKTSYVPGEPGNVSSLLHSLGLGKYAILFQAEEVDMAALKQMGDTDLKELGIPMGPRKKILLALLPRAKQRQP